MKKKFGIIGGDARITYLAQMFAKENCEIYIYGQEKNKEKIDKIKNCTICYGLRETIEKAENIISSIPFSKDGVNIYAPFSEKNIEISELIKHIENKTFFAGSISKDIVQKIESKNAKIIDLMNEEDLTILNTIATAEGTISEIILNTNKNIHGSNILILGFGRVAKILAKKLASLDAYVTCAARKDKDFAWMETFGLETTNINKLGENLKKYDVIINTVPQLILDENKLKNVQKESLIIDLASKPGGVDTKSCEKLGLKFIWALAIPGKVAPLTSAQYIKNTIEKFIKEGDDN